MSLLRPYLISILILANLGSALIVPLVYLDFEVRKEYIQRVLCIKRDKPITICGGSCYLAKRLHHAEKSQDQTEVATPPAFTFFSKDLLEFSLIRRQVLIKTTEHLSFNDLFPGSLPAFDIFHPPRKA
ncbi:MAG: hypothetical protein RIC35_04455 [Marinoscillum sp.]